MFPELGVSGYAISDLLQQTTLLDAVEAAIDTLVAASTDLLPLLLVGAPLRHLGALYNCALAIHRGRLLGVVPKIHLPNYREFYEPRHFVSGDGTDGGTITVGGRTRAVRPRPAVRRRRTCRGFVVHAEICEDMWVPIPPSGEAAVAGATVLANLSASNITIGKAETRRLLCRSQSARCLAAYLYAAAGAGESTTDLAWDGQASVFENGDTAGRDRTVSRRRTRRRSPISTSTCCAQERLQMGSFDTNRRRHARAVPHASAFRLDPPAGDIGFRRQIERFPFVPADRRRGSSRIATRPTTSRSPAWRSGCARPASKRVVIGDFRRAGFDPGADRLRAAFDLLGLPRGGHPGLHDAGLRDLRSRPSAMRWALMRSLGVTAAELDIRPAATQMLTDIGHPYAAGEPVYDVTFENVQAGLRTDYLFRLANHHGGIVIGTGDLSELALGWCTYGVGDQMAHYNVNAGVPKTLIQHLIRWVIGSNQFAPRGAGDAGRDPGDRDLAGTGAGGRGRDAAEHRGARSVPTRCRISPCSTCCATASCRRRSPSWRCTPGRTPSAATGRRISRRPARRRTT